MRRLTWIILAAAALTVALVLPAAGQAGAAPAIAWVSPPNSGSYDYGAVTHGQTASHTFTLTNSGGSATGVLSVSKSGAAAFSITSNACTGTSLGKGKSCAVRVAYAPTTVGESDTATLIARGKRPPAGASITLTGTGGAVGTTSFTYTGAAQTFSVPTGVTQIAATVVGGSQVTNHGPFGEVVNATLPVTSGETLDVYVGGAAGADGNAGGFNGGGSGCDLCGGAGASDLREGGTELGNRIIVAGGVGGTSSNGPGGPFTGGIAGFTTGGNGNDIPGFSGSGGGGGGQSPSSNGGTISGGIVTVNGSSGELGTGGNASSLGSGAGGGGGGYYGGGGGAGVLNENGIFGAGGGGGSSFVESSGTNVSDSQGFDQECDGNNGCITISW